MKNVLKIATAVGLFSGFAAAQPAIVQGQSGVYVEQYVNNQWSRVSNFPDRYRLDQQGNPDPMQGLSGVGLNQIAFSTVTGRNYSIFASSNASSTSIGDIDVSGDGIVTVGRYNTWPPQVTPGITNNFVPGCNNIDSISTLGGKSEWNVKIAGDLNGGFSAYRIVNLVCDDIRGAVINTLSNDPAAPAFGRIQCNNILSTGSVTSQVVTLSYIEVNGNVAGSVRAVGGGVLNNCIIDGALSGTVQAANGASLNQCTVGSVSSGGEILASGYMDKFLVKDNGNMDGLVQVTGHLKECGVGGNLGGVVDVAGSLFEIAKVGTLDGGAITVGGDIEFLWFTGSAFGGSVSTGGELKKILVDGSWGVNGSTLSSYDPMSLSIPQNKLENIQVGGDFVGDLVGYTLDRFFVDGNIYGYDLNTQNVIPSNFTTTSDIRRFAAVSWPLSPLGQDEAMLNLTAPTVGAFYIGGFFEKGLVDLTNGIDVEFLNKIGSPEPTAFRLGGGMGVDAQFHFGFDASDPTRQGIASKLVYLNHRNNAEPWDGEVSVGLSPTDSNRTILDENYTILSGAIGGGGSFGNVPFNFHQRVAAPPVGESYDCNPYQTEVVHVNAVRSLDKVVISHYGPVYYSVEPDDLTPMPFRIEFKPAFAPFPNSASWVDRSDLFEVLTETQNPDGTTTVWTNTSDLQAVRNRNIVIQGNSAKNNHGFEAAGTWRIHLKDEYFKCAGVFQTPVVKWVSGIQAENCSDSDGTVYSWYQFRVLLEAGGGGSLLQGGNGPEASDLSEWIIEPFETNADGETDTQDFIDMANVYTGN